MDISQQKIAELALFMVPFLFSLSFHEFAHGWVASKKGDNTAEMLGRLSLNPFVHADPIGTFIFPTLGFLFGWPLFGWAKPVPVNGRNLKNYRSDMFWIAAAGPLSNVLLAIVGVFGLIFFYKYGQGLSYATPLNKMFSMFVTLNLFLAVFNLIPMHPLDGGKILARFLPEKANEFLENNQMIFSYILIILAFTGGLAILAYPVTWMSRFLINIASAMVL